MIKFILEYLFLFLTGATLGWGLEVIYRRYFGKARKWINPGFLSGPYLPLYGTGVCLLYIVSELPLSLGFKIVLFALITTGIEYLTGLFFLKIYNTRLWDYTKFRLNVQGIITPLYSLFWTLLSLFFYYVLYPYFYQHVTFLYEHLEFSLFIGAFYGVIGVDVVESFNVLARLKKVADSLEHSQIAIDYDRLKMDIYERFDELTVKVEDLSGRLEGFGGKVSAHRPKVRKPTYLMPFRGDYNLRLHMQAHFETLKEDKNKRKNNKK